MALSNKTVGIIVTLIAISVTGLILLQVTLLDSSKTLKEQTFRRNVFNALSATADQLETLEATVAAIEIAGDSSLPRQVNIVSRVTVDDSIDSSKRKIMIIAKDTSFVDSSMSVGLAFISPDSQCFIDTILYDRNAGDNQGLAGFEAENIDSGRHIYRMNIDADSGRAEFLMEIVNRIWSGKIKPIKERINLNELDSILRSNLDEAGVDMEYFYTIRETGNDSLWPAPGSYKNQLLSSQFKTRLFPRDLISPPSELLVYFPAGDFYVWKQISPMLILTALFLIIIIFSFIYTIRIIISQRKNAALMVDFVNNMTHEFKTPISTVALAGEAILKPEVLSDEEKIRRYSSMILDENRRMRSHVDKILQMATLEQGDFELNLREIDTHKLISQVAESLTLQIESRGGIMETSLTAENCTISADKDHLMNIIYNLLDNAIKYSPENPQVTISTRNADGKLLIGIDDKGRGIHPDDLKLIFKKYYRVSTGNLHDVKGFGLGLSYVKLMVEAHSGDITIKSRLGEGTYAEIRFPLAKGAGGTGA